MITLIIIITRSFDQATRECQPFLFGGCHGNANRFETQDDCRIACGGNGTSSGLTTLPAPAPPRRPGGGFMLGGGGGVAGGHSAVPVNREVKMVAAKGKSLLATSARITGSECSHADLLGVIRAESQVCCEKSQTQKRNTNLQKQTTPGGGRHKLSAGFENQTKNWIWMFGQLGTGDFFKKIR